MLIVMAGLPGTGKSTVARRLSQILRAPVLDKDAIRAALFRPEDIEYSRQQDDLCVEIALQVAAFLLRRRQNRPVILDGRTFSRSEDVTHLLDAAQTMSAQVVFIECVCSEETALQRLEQDQMTGTHPAKNRGIALYRHLRATADPLTTPHLSVNTEEPLDDVITACLAYLDHLSGGVTTWVDRER